MAKLFEIPVDTEIAPENLEAAIQQAIQLEQATIPVYLYSYYSINRAWSQDESEKPGTSSGLRKQIKADMKAAGIVSASDITEELIQKLSVDIQVYANKSAALIMSVAIEEMLHMALSSNVKQSLFGAPDLYNSLSALDFPVDLPGHEPELPLPLMQFCPEWLVTALRVESPLPYKPDPNLKSKVVTFYTIGDFYAMIEDCVRKNFSDPSAYNTTRPQLLPNRNYYFPNSINTVYYDRQHCPHFASADDSGDLVHVRDMDTALHAMDIVVEQGEGHQGSNHLDENGNPQCDKVDWDNLKAADYDDPKKQELSHYMKFLEAYCLGQKHIKKFEEYGLDFEKYFIYNFPANPKTNAKDLKKGSALAYSQIADEKLRDDLVATSNLINAVYSYLFLMVETCYYKDGHTQFEVFMMGIHKSMIWALSELCNGCRKWTFEMPDADGNPIEYNFAPTFERWDFAINPDGSKKTATPKEQLVELILKAPADANGKDVSWTIDYVAAFPDVSVDHEVSINPLLPTVPGEKKAQEKWDKIKNA